MINAMLASILSAINAVLALGIILAGARIGSGWADTNGFSQGLGIVGGLAAGLLVAVLVCGLLAVLLDIRAGVKEVAHLLKRHELPPHGPV
jgi:hypothetical protein